MKLQERIKVMKSWYAALDSKAVVSAPNPMLGFFTDEERDDKDFATIISLMQFYGWGVAASPEMMKEIHLENASVLLKSGLVRTLETSGCSSQIQNARFARWVVNDLDWTNIRNIGVFEEGFETEINGIPFITKCIEESPNLESLQIHKKMNPETIQAILPSLLSRRRPLKHLSISKLQQSWLSADSVVELIYELKGMYGANCEMFFDWDEVSNEQRD